MQWSSENGFKSYLPTLNGFLGHICKQKRNSSLTKERAYSKSAGPLRFHLISFLRKAEKQKRREDEDFQFSEESLLPNFGGNIKFQRPDLHKIQI